MIFRNILGNTNQVNPKTWRRFILELFGEESYKGQGSIGHLSWHFHSFVIVKNQTSGVPLKQTSSRNTSKILDFDAFFQRKLLVKDSL